MSKLAYQQNDQLDGLMSTKQTMFWVKFFKYNKVKDRAARVTLPWTLI